MHVLWFFCHCPLCEIAETVSTSCQSSESPASHLRGVYSDTTQLDVELSWWSVYSDTTQLNSTSSCRLVHSVNNCHLSMNVVTQLTQFVGHDFINKNILKYYWIDCDAAGSRAWNDQLWGLGGQISRSHETGDRFGGWWRHHSRPPSVE